MLVNLSTNCIGENWEWDVCLSLFVNDKHSFIHSKMSSTVHIYT
jgi:hypothetical protein